jgi:hypothetical protein
MLEKMASPITDLSWCDVGMPQWKYWGKTVISRIFIAYCFPSHPDVGALSDGCYVSMERNCCLWTSNYWCQIAAKAVRSFCFQPSADTGQEKKIIPCCTKF